MRRPRTDDGPRLVTEGQPPSQIKFTAHDVHMRELATRIRWLESHRHWWIRSIEGRST